MNTPADSAQTLALAKPGPAGTALGLRKNDVLAAINGKPFTGDETALHDCFAQAKGRPLALTFMRDGSDVTVLSEHAKLGQWEPDAVPNWSGEHRDPAALRNWEVLRDKSGRYDLHPLSRDTLALFAAPVWMLKNRLWVQTAVIVAAIIVSAAIWLPLGAAVYALTGILMHKTGPDIVRVDRIERGLQPCAIIAARSESEAHEAYRKMDPQGRFLFE